MGAIVLRVRQTVKLKEFSPRVLLRSGLRTTPRPRGSGPNSIFIYSKFTMPEFCDVAVPVPLDMAFTYRLPPDSAPFVGGRVLLPILQQRTTGIVVDLHD